MICLCCKNGIVAGSASCNVCGMPALVGKNVSDERLKNEIEKTRKQYLEGISIDLKIFDYEISNRHITDQGNCYIKLIDAIVLAEDTYWDNIWWFDEKFEEVDTEQPFSVGLSIMRKGTEEEVVISFSPNKRLRCQSFGIMMTQGFRCRFVVGCKDSYEVSEEVSLIHKMN